MLTDQTMISSSKSNAEENSCANYRAFHGFGQAKGPNGGLVLGSS